MTVCWLAHDLASNFTAGTPIAAADAIRMAVVIATAQKFIADLFRGGWNQLAVGSLTWYRIHSHPLVAVGRFHKAILIVRLGAVICYAATPYWRVAAVVIAAGLVYELIYEFRYHVVFITAVTLLTGFFAESQTLLHRPLHESSYVDGNGWALFMIALLTVNLYWSSAVRKWQSEDFRSGFRLALYVEHAISIQPLLPYFEFWFPAAVARYLTPAAAPVVLSRWRALSLLTIALEASLPFLLLFTPTFPYAVVLGIGMHLGFLALEPVGLFSFQVTTIATYIAFYPGALSSR